MNLYSLQYIAIILLLDKIFTMNLELAKRSKEIYSKFLRFNEELIRFINNHQFIKGFQISTKDFMKTDPRIISSIDEYISIQLNSLENQYETIELKEIIKDVPFFDVTTIPDLRKKSRLDSFLIMETPSEKIKNDEYFQNVFKSQFNCDEDEYHEKVYKPVKENTQHTKKQLANLVGSDIRRKTAPYGEKIKLKVNESSEIIKKPILCLGNHWDEKSVTPNKNRIGAIKFVYSSIPSNKNIQKNKSESIGAKPRERRRSVMIPIIRKKLLNQTIDFQLDFEPDFDEAIFETFPHSFSNDFKVEKNWIVKDDGNYVKNPLRSSLLS